MKGISCLPQVGATSCSLHTPAALQNLTIPCPNLSSQDCSVLYLFLTSGPDFLGSNLSFWRKRASITSCSMPQWGYPAMAVLLHSLSLLQENGSSSAKAGGSFILQIFKGKGAKKMGALPGQAWALLFLPKLLSRLPVPITRNPHRDPAGRSLPPHSPCL